MEDENLFDKFINAIDDNNYSIVKECIIEGVDVNGLNRQSPEKRFSRTDVQYPILIAAFKCDIKMIKLLVKNGADIHITDSRKVNVLEWSVYGEKLENLKYFIGEGVDVNLLNKKGRNCLWMAITLTNEKQPNTKDIKVCYNIIIELLNNEIELELDNENILLQKLKWYALSDEFIQDAILSNYPYLLKDLEKKTIIKKVIKNKHSDLYDFDELGLI